MQALNKSDLIEIIAEKSNISLKDATEVVAAIFDLMSEALIAGGRVEIRGFGSFVNKEYLPYTGRNPKTGEEIKVPAKRLPFFKAGKELRERVDLVNAWGGSDETATETSADDSLV